MTMATKKSKVIPFSPAKAVAYHADIERENNVIGSRIEEARVMRGLSQKDFCQLLSAYGVEVTPTAISKWTARGSIPNAYQLVAICHALQIDDGLMYFTRDYMPQLNADGIRKVENYRADLIASGNYKPQARADKKIRYIKMPISSLSVSAGTGAFLDEGNFEMVEFPENAVPAGADFGVRVSGNSMEPVYHDGQIVWVHQCEIVTPGQVGIFTCDGEGFMKVYHEQEPDEEYAEDYTDSYGVVRMQPVLVSYNQDYPDRIIPPTSTFQVVGRVL